MNLLPAKEVELVLGFIQIHLFNLKDPKKIKQQYKTDSYLAMASPLGVWKPLIRTAVAVPLG